MALPISASTIRNQISTRSVPSNNRRKGVETYIDDILIYAPTEEEHDRRHRAVLQRCRDANLSLNKDKYVNKTQELKYLGHIISPDGVKADPAKVAAIVDMPVPESKEDVRRFIGLINYLLKYCPNLSSITIS